ncbi:MAG: UDP-2,3-diacylglucosamine hydrolase [Gammaproteobacteria bacterium]|jgi:UDP-2,3-diacylglucosamine hydrolase
MSISDEYLFISDCHVDASKPEITANLLEFLQKRGKDAQFLYILGDLFEVWLGDDDDSSVNDAIIDCLQSLAKNTEIFFLPGNRDFLLGDQTAQKIGLTRIDDLTCLQLGDHRVVLLHGDTLCTDDTDYQSFRQMVRDANWQAQFLQKPLAERQAIAAALRVESKKAMAQKAVEIMDVNIDAVANCFEESKADIIIHGHTHRPAKHSYANNRIRYVLGDWAPKASYLSWTSDKGFELIDPRVN